VDLETGFIGSQRFRRIIKCRCRQGATRASADFATVVETASLVTGSDAAIEQADAGQVIVHAHTPRRLAEIAACVVGLERGARTGQQVVIDGGAHAALVVAGITDTGRQLQIIGEIIRPWAKAPLVTALVGSWKPNRLLGPKKSRMKKAMPDCSLK
jgi:hypothetical protein